ncbi:ABC transporter transmembrane domain-containing protein [Marinitoga lauensis]|uniref:ABC transporter transmembrane domain-containing protein n=1 Tax=Marinitoga lauensis TaxID=2201189 RepID=UPI0010118C84|nr:ABC transporter ATP-binding protein [Marinitoga lauensis]
MKKYLKIIKNKRLEFIILLIFTSALSFFEGLIQPLMVKWLFDEAILKMNFKKFVLLSIIYLGLGITFVILFYIHSLWKKKFENKIVLNLESELLEKTLNHDLKEYKEKGFGYFVNSIHKDVQEGIVPYIEMILTIVSMIISEIALLIAMFYISWKASLILFIIVPPLMYISTIVSQKVRDKTAIEREKEGEYINYLTNTLKAFKILKTFIRIFEKSAFKHRKYLEEYLNSSYESHKAIKSAQVLGDIIRNSADATSLIVAGYFVLIGKLSFGGFVAIINSFWRAVSSLFGIIQSVPELQRFSEILERITKLLELKDKRYYEIDNKIKLENIKLSYKNKKILDIKDLNIELNKKMLIVGPNGSGKTTILDIISGHLAPDNGKIIRPKEVLSLTAPLELPELKVTELIENEEIIKKLGLEKLKEKEASKLSAGEKQKVGIGLTLENESVAYIFDEPLTNIDENSKKKIIDLILEKTKNKTLIMVLHGEKEFHKLFDEKLRIDTINNVESETL